MLFGPERAGLENDDVSRASAIISVPVNPAFASLNLAQCVLLTGYEWQRAVGQVTPEAMQMDNTDWAAQADIEALAQHYEAQMDEAGFFFPDHKADSMRQTLRNFWSRMPMTQADTRLLHGILRQMVRWKNRG